MRHDYDKILTRLITILQRLYEGESLHVAALAEEFNVSTKTIQRDFNERLIRFPIAKSGRGWSMQAGFRIERSRKPEEAMVLDTLETIAAGIGSGYGAIAASLLGRLKNPTVASVNSKTVIEDILDCQYIFVQLEEAIAARRVVSFDYKGRNRTVSPCKIVSFEGYWYLYGEEQPREALKTFYLKNIGGLNLTEATFAPHAEAEAILDRALNSWFEPGNKPFTATLHASAAIAVYFGRRPLSPTQRIVQTYPDGSIDMDVEITSSRELLHEVKKWIPDLLVRAPESLVAEADAMARAFAEAQCRAVEG